MARFGVRLRNMFILGFKQLQDPYYQGFAAQIAFYLLLSIVPIILLVTQILGVFDISIASALSLFESYTGHKIPTIMEKLFEFSSARIREYHFSGDRSVGRITGILFYHADHQLYDDRRTEHRKKLLCREDPFDSYHDRDYYYGRVCHRDPCLW